jgi:hypothetical protein
MKLDIKAIEKRLEAATKGPWRGEKHSIYVWGADGGMVADNITQLDWKEHGEIARMRGVGMGRYESGELQANYDFIVHARQDVPDLLALVREMRAALMCHQFNGAMCGALKRANCDCPPCTLYRETTP